MEQCADHRLTAEPPHLRVEVVRDRDDDAVVHLIGELDLASAPTLARVVDEQLDLGVRSLTIDLAQVRFVDGTALGILVHTHHRLRTARGGQVLTGLRPGAVRLLAITHLDEVLFTAGAPGDTPTRRVCSDPAAHHVAPPGPATGRPPTRQ